MLCPKCGSKIQEELLYCPKCGEEIQYVPEFEPVIEQKIQKSLSKVEQAVAEGYEESQNAYKAKKYAKTEYPEDEYIDSESTEDEFLDAEYNNGDALDSEYADAEYPETAYAEDEFAEDEYYEPAYAEDEYYEPAYDGEESIEEFEDTRFSSGSSEEGIDVYDYDEDGLDDYGENGAYDYGEDGLDEFDEEYDDNFDDDEDDIEVIGSIRHFLQKKRNRILFSILLGILCAGIGVGVVYIKNVSKTVVENNSPSYQASLARQAALSGDYELAIQYMEKALSLNSSDSTMKYDLAQYYFKNDESEKAILILWEIIYGKENGYENAYAQMIEYYVTQKDYQMIKDILDNCDSENVISKYSEYLANAPEFSQPEGTYEEAFDLVLSSASAGTIYYTVDGTEPTYESDVYDQPLSLELGRYTIIAFFVNSYGIVSDSVKMTYTIDIKVPDAPVLLLEDGDYEMPELIEVEAQKFCTVYYTTDGTTPTIDSNEYTGPIPMPLGASHFIFAAYSQEGVCGELAEADYVLILDSEVMISDVITNIQQYNLNMGKTSNLSGLVLNGSSVYSYTVSSAIAFGEKPEVSEDAEKTEDERDCYYIIVETLTDINNVTMKTGTIYLADALTGDLYQASKDSETGLPVLGAQIDPALYTAIGAAAAAQTP